MSLDAHGCCRCAVRIREGKHDFMARVGDEIIVIKDVPALVCDTCGEVEYTLDVSRDRCDHGRIIRRTAAGKAPGGGGGSIQTPECRLNSISIAGSAAVLCHLS